MYCAVVSFASCILPLIYALNQEPIMQSDCYVSIYFTDLYCHQCFDAVGWDAGRHLACKKLSYEVLACLSV